MSKKTDSSKKNIVEKKINDLLSIVKKETFFDKIEPIIKKKIQFALEDPKIVPKVENSSISVPSSIKSSSNVSNEKKMLGDFSISGNSSSQ